MKIKPEADSKAKIKVVGVGGAGCNVLNTMIEESRIQGVEFIAVNTDLQALAGNKAPVKIEIGKQLTAGLGAGSQPEIGEKAAKESEEELRNILEDADMVFISAGMGGGTGTGAAPVIAKIARSLGALTVGVVTKPFNFEGARRSQNAELGIENLKREVDALITVPNQKLIEINDPKLSFKDAFKISDSVLTQGVQGISDLIVIPGLVNVDFADVSTTMRNSGTALMGIGIGSGENRAEIAARQAITSPLLEVKIDGAKGILYNIVMSPDVSIVEVDKASRIITESASPDAQIKYGASFDDSLTDQIKITVIATGFDSGSYSYNQASRKDIKPFNTTPLDIPTRKYDFEEDSIEVSEIIEEPQLPKFNQTQTTSFTRENPVNLNPQMGFGTQQVYQAPQQPAQAPKKSFFGGFGNTQNINEKANEYAVINPAQFEDEDDNYEETNKQQVDEDDYMVPPFLRNRK